MKLFLSPCEDSSEFKQKRREKLYLPPPPLLLHPLPLLIFFSYFVFVLEARSTAHLSPPSPTCHSIIFVSLYSIDRAYNPHSVLVHMGYTCRCHLLFYARLLSTFFSGSPLGLGVGEFGGRNVYPTPTTTKVKKLKMPLTFRQNDVFHIHSHC